MIRVSIPLLLVAMAFAGCFGNSSKNDPARDTEGQSLIDLPPGCMPDRLVVAHRAGGLMVPTPSDVPVACFHRLGTEAVEPTIGIDGAGAVYYYPVDYYIFAGVHEPRRVVSMARSTDEGGAWQVLTPTVGGVPVHAFSNDPAFFVDPVTGRIFAENTQGPCATMVFSDDSGVTWMPSSGSCLVAERVSLLAGLPVSSSPTDYPNVVYRCGLSDGRTGQESAAVACQRSLDGGSTWQLPGEPAYEFNPQVLHDAAALIGEETCMGGSPRAVTGVDGALYLPRGHCGQPWLAISRDEAQTWTRGQVSDLGNPCFDHIEGPICEVEAGFGIDGNGTLYYLWVARDDRLPYLVRSFDGGTTWTSPLMVAAPGLNEVSLVRLAAGGEGRIALAYFGTSTSPGAPFSTSYEDPTYDGTTWDAYMAVSYDAAGDDPMFLTSRMNEDDDPLIRGTCGPVRCGAVYDFIDLRIAPDGTPWAPFVDGCFEPCERSGTEQRSEALTGRLWGGPSLWDAADSNGPYPEP